MTLYIGTSHYTYLLNSARAAHWALTCVNSVAARLATRQAALTSTSSASGWEFSTWHTGPPLNRSSWKSTHTWINTTSSSICPWCLSQMLLRHFCWRHWRKSSIHNHKLGVNHGNFVKLTWTNFDKGEFAYTLFSQFSAISPKVKSLLFKLLNVCSYIGS